MKPLHIIEQRICSTCGNSFEFKIYKSRVGRGKFCSRKCFVPHNKKNGYLNGGYKRLAIGRYGKIYEHQLVAQEMLGRKLNKGEIVHHINHNKLDNRPENLLVITQSEHKKIHFTPRDERTGRFI